MAGVESRSGTTGLDIGTGCHGWLVPVLLPRRSEHALSIKTQLDSTHVPHLVNGLSLEISRQADRIRRRSHTRDWPGAASAMTELQEAVAVLGQLVNNSLRASFVTDDPEEEEPAAPASAPVSTGQYL